VQEIKSPGRPHISTDAETTKRIVEAFDASPQKSTHQAAQIYSHGNRQEFDRVYQRIQLEEQENRHENNGSGFIAENSGPRNSSLIKIFNVYLSHSNAWPGLLAVSKVLIFNK
ncbi:hypothetical protein L9F63_006398, partial [Diploptera punctata]